MVLNIPRFLKSHFLLGMGIGYVSFPVLQIQINIFPILMRAQHFASLYPDYG